MQLHRNVHGITNPKQQGNLFLGVPVNRGAIDGVQDTSNQPPHQAIMVQVGIDIMGEHSWVPQRFRGFVGWLLNNMFGLVKMSPQQGKAWKLKRVITAIETLNRPKEIAHCMDSMRDRYWSNILDVSSLGWFLRGFSPIIVSYFFGAMHSMPLSSCKNSCPWWKELGLFPFNLTLCFGSRTSMKYTAMYLQIPFLGHNQISGLALHGMNPGVSNSVWKELQDNTITLYYG